MLDDFRFTGSTSLKNARGVAENIHQWNPKTMKDFSALEPKVNTTRTQYGIYDLAEPHKKGLRL